MTATGITLSILCYVSILALTGYMIFIMTRFKELPSSLSNSAYYMASINKKLKYIFTIIMWMIIIPITGVLFEVTDGKWYQFMAFLLIAGLMFVSVTPSYKDERTENIVHKTGAGFAIVGALSYSVLLVGWFPMIVFVLTILFVHILVISFDLYPTDKYVNKDKNNIILEIELGTFVAAYSTTLEMIYKYF